MITEIDKKDFIKRLQKKIGTPFRHRGRTASGVDCIGLLAVTFSEMGEDILDKKVYGREPRNDRLKENVDANLGAPIYLKPNSKNLLEVADIVLIRFNKEPHHIAVVNKNNNGYTIIHAYGAAEKVVEHRLDDDWYAKITHVYRLKDRIK